MSTNFEVDHVFVFVKPGGPEAELLAGLGLKEGVRRTHRGQGTSNVSFFFGNAYLELIWASDEAEIRSEVARPLLLWERSRWREDGASPFGVCFRPIGTKIARPPFKTWAYLPPYLPPEMSIEMGVNSGRAHEPLLFFIPQAMRPDAWPAERRPPLEHPLGLRELTEARVTHPGAEPLSAEWAAPEEAGLVTFAGGTEHRLELVFDGGRAGKTRELAPRLPLALSW